MYRAVGGAQSLTVRYAICHNDVSVYIYIMYIMTRIITRMTIIIAITLLTTAITLLLLLIIVRLLTVINNNNSDNYKNNDKDNGTGLNT